jgi:Flp pilus assembly protein TadD
MPANSETRVLASTLAEIARAIQATDFKRAFDHANTALNRGLVHPRLYSTRAVWFAQQNRDDLALPEFQRALSYAPEDLLLLNAIGLCLTRLRRFGEAAEMFDRAARFHPKDSASRFRKGYALAMAGQHDGAEACLQQALELDPGNAEILSNLASLALGADDAQAAQALARRALAINPQDATANTVLASVEILHRDFAAAELRMTALLEGASLPPRGRAVAHGLLADALDGQDRTAEAFGHYLSEKAALKSLSDPAFARSRRVVDVVNDLATYFSNAPTEWALSAADDGGDAEGPETHVFLVGFIRSGTTLVEQILASHPDIATLDERDCMAEPAERYLTNYAGLERFATLTDDAIAQERSSYWRRVKENRVDLGKPVFVDKLPLNIIKLALVARFFPRARVLFAVRDPRDVILSCFRRHFEVNAAMYELLTLDGAARFYDAVMRLGEVSHEMLPSPFLRFRYEDLVSEFDATLADICDFIGVLVQDMMRDFTKTRPTQPILSPSGKQVRKALHTDSVGQWRRYAAPLAPVLPILDRWIDAFGYPHG